MTMIERVAMAICGSNESFSPFTKDNYWPSQLAAARAAIAAMREPTEAMLIAHPGTWNNEEAKADWHAMIDAALEEK